MNLLAYQSRLPVHAQHLRNMIACGLLAMITLGVNSVSSAQSLQPQPTPVSTPNVDPVSDPSPSPIATPTASPADIPTATPSSTPTSTPQSTIIPGLPDPAVIAAYDAARTPLVDIALNPVTTTNGGTASGVAATGAAIQTVRQSVHSRMCTQTVFPSPAKPGGKISNANTAATGAASQPVAVVVLTYDPSCAGQVVWVQMTGAGTLTASDGAGRTYDGSKGFLLTLDQNAMATFNYQPPNVSGTYQVLTRFSNVKTFLPFLVPDPAP